MRDILSVLSWNAVITSYVSWGDFISSLYYQLNEASPSLLFLGLTRTTLSDVPNFSMELGNMLPLDGGTIYQIAVPPQNCLRDANLVENNGTHSSSLNIIFLRKIRSNHDFFVSVVYQILFSLRGSSTLRDYGRPRKVASMVDLI